MRRQAWADLELGYEPPLRAGVPAYPDRRMVNVRWMAATVLMATAASLLLIGALYSAIGVRIRFAMVPVMVKSRLMRQEVVEAGRGDRDVHRKGGIETSQSSVQIEQLSDSGSVRPYTRVSARLGEIDVEPDLEDDSPSKAENVSDSGSITPPLPPLILFGTSRPPIPPSVSAYADDDSLSHAQQPIGQPINVTVVPKSAETHDLSQRVVIARAEDSLPAILGALAVKPDDAEAIAAAFPKRHWFGKEMFTGGEVITVLEDFPDLSSLGVHVLKVTIERRGNEAVAVARTDRGEYKLVVPEQSDGQLQSNEATSDNAIDLRQTAGETLRESLDALARSDHLDEAVIAELIRLCSRDFDLEGPVDRSDTVDILYAPDELGQPELVFVAIAAQGQSRRYYRFTAPDDDSTDFYDVSGHSITKFLLRKPVVSGRLGDGFGWRIHPILGDRRFHEGVDYAAPYGSPIAAAGAGVIEIIGQQWGYGKYIRIRHDLGYETTYAHISGVPRGLKVGGRVRQGETIAYVGSSGLSTGPHLYYEVHINGHNVDPLSIRLASGRVLSGKILASFLRSRRHIDELIDVPAGASASR